MVPLTTLYDDYIDRPNLTEQKKPFEYIVPPPIKWVGTTKFAISSQKLLVYVFSLLGSISPLEPFNGLPNYSY